MRRFVLALACPMLATPALAHAFLDKAIPAAGDSVKGSPTQVELHFSEALEPAFSAVTVQGESGEDEEAAATMVSGKILRVRLKSLKPGRYEVRWTAVSIDTHRTEGAYKFSVLP